MILQKSQIELLRSQRQIRWKLFRVVVLLLRGCIAKFKTSFQLNASSKTIKISIGISIQVAFN